MDNKDRMFWVSFAKIPRVGAQKFRKLISYFGNLEAAWKSGAADLIKAGLDEKTVFQIGDARKKIDPGYETEKLRKEKIQIVTFLDKNYPRLLAEIYNPPALFFLKGNIENLKLPGLAIVGTRKVSAYGKNVARNLSYELAQCGLNIVSGMALGIDAACHEGALRAGGKTLAVLASGVDKKSVSPPSNYQLSEKILTNGGCLLSEFAPGTKPLKQNFPVRNRIISGLCPGTLVVEAMEKSGALITANYALEQNRHVFAVPGSIYSPQSFGPNKLIKMGAVPVTSAADITEVLNLKNIKIEKEVKKILPENPEEKLIYQILSSGTLNIDRIVFFSGLNIKTVNFCLTILEMKGMIVNLGAGNYARR
ncbi:DNA-protecting protein DprA [Candidatus Parcubacteria bacterium]|nr:MAG: DNA-protecting protein DprA [Candidatus Parcubacteria bacterium]